MRCVVRGLPAWRSSAFGREELRHLRRHPPLALRSCANDASRPAPASEVRDNVPTLSSVEQIEREFQDASSAFSSKTTYELGRAWAVFQVCSIGPVVRYCDKLYTMGLKIVGPRITHFILRKTFFDHFCAGETSQEIMPRMEQFRKIGVGGILDYAAEAKDGELPEVEAVAQSEEEETVGAPLSSRKYDYKGEAICNANAKIFRNAVRGVKDATPNGFAAIKLSGLGNPIFLERMSTCIVEQTRMFKRLSEEDFDAKVPFYTIDRSFRFDFDAFKAGWWKLFSDKPEAELKEMFDAMDFDKDGFVSYLEWSSSMSLSETNKLVKSCRNKGRLWKAALDEEELDLYRKMVERVKGILDLAHELGVRVMIDAEWTDIQPAIDHLVIHFQRMYNKGDQPIVFNTYQTYLKGMELRVVRDLRRSRREGWRFGAKVVRGAYMVSERQKALTRGLPSPICDTYEESEANFNAAIDAILAHSAVEGPCPGAAAAECLVASHNRISIERTLHKMVELGVSQDLVGFGQLMGMADHLTFTLGRHGYRAYKYVPYGPLEEVVPYLIRRTQENSAILGSPSVQEERKMLGQEVFARLRPF